MASKCTAHRSNGDPCGNYPIAGGRVCRYHGGSAPAVRAAAAARLVDAELQKASNRIQAKTEKLRYEEAERRLALKPWIEELGPRYIWDMHSPATLRRIATEMRSAAAELIMLASSNGRQSQCTKP